MRSVVTKDNLSKALGSVSHLTSKTAALPILRNILLEVQPSGLTLSATNLEVGVRAHARGKVEVVGSCTVDARVLSELVTTLPSAPITLELSGTNLIVSAKGAKSTLKTLPTEEFPVIPFPTKKESRTLPLRELLTALAQVSYAASGDDGRPELTGVFWQWVDKNLTLAATDSYRLAERVVKMKSAGTDVNVLLPAKLLSDLGRSLGSDDAEVRVGMAENQAVFETDHAELVSRVIDGQFPEYRGIIPTGHSTTATVSVADLTRALKAAGLFVRPGVNDATIAVEKSSVTVSAANTQVGEGATEVTASVDGEPLTVVFNYRYLLDALATIPGDEVRLEFSGAANPAVLRPASEAGLTALVMPIRA